MPWYRNGFSIPVIDKSGKTWWVDWSSEKDQQGFDSWKSAIDYARTTHHPNPYEGE